MPSRSPKSKQKRPQAQASPDEYDPVVQESVDFVLSSIRDPQNVQHCGRCLLGALLALLPSAAVIDGEMDAMMPKIAKNDIFWENIYNFLVMKRTEEQMGLLLTRFSRCNCNFQDKNIKVYHDEGLNMEPSVMDRTYMKSFAEDSKKSMLTAERCAVAVKIFYLLHGYLAKCPMNSAGKAKARQWPHTALDLVRHGPENTIASLLQWYSHVADPSVFSIIGAITRLGQFIIIPTVVQFKISQLVVESTRMVVDITMDNLKRLDTMTRNGKAPTLSSSTRFIMRKFGYHTRSVFEYLSGFSLLPLDLRSSLLRGSETKLMQLCSIIVYLVSDPRYQTQVFPEFARYFKFFSEYGQWLFRFYYMHLYPRPDIPVHPQIVDHDKRTFPPPAPRRSTEEAAIHYIAAFRESRRCSAYLCPNSMQSVGRAFQRCAGCNVVSYCGRECQTKAWRTEEYPHKRICPILRTLVDAGGGHVMFFPGNDKLPSIPLLEILRITDLQPYILRNWKIANVSEEDLKYLCLWGKWHDSSCARPDDSEWTPGFEDYDELIAQLTQPKGPGPKAGYIDRLVKWPSEVVKEKELLKAQAFWNEDIEC